MIASSTVRPALEWISASAGGEHVAHPVGEAHQPQARLVAEALSTRAREACRCARTGTARSRPAPASAARVAPTRSPTPQPPPETAITLPSAGSPSARRASARERAARNAGEVGGLAQRTLPGPAICSTSSIDSGWVTKCRSIPGCAQKLQPGEVGDRRVAGDVEPALAAQLAEHRGHAGIGRDDQVRVVRADQPHQPAAPERRQQPLGEPARRREVHEQPVLEVEQPRHPAEHERRVLAQHLGQDRPHRGQAVDDRDLGVGVLVVELAGDRAGRQIVALADVGRDDQHLARLASASGSPAGITAASSRSAARRLLLAAPVDVPAHALGERRRRGPAELAARRACCRRSCRRSPRAAPACRRSRRCRSAPGPSRRSA